MRHLHSFTEGSRRLDEVLQNLLVVQIGSGRRCFSWDVFPTKADWLWGKIKVFPLRVNTHMQLHTTRCLPVRHRRKELKTTSSWFSCVSSRCCEISLRSSSRVLRGNGGWCWARSLSWSSPCLLRGTDTRAGCSSRTGRSMLPQKKPVFPNLLPFRRRKAALVLLTGRVSERVNRWCQPLFIYTRSRDRRSVTCSFKMGILWNF